MYSLKHLNKTTNVNKTNNNNNVNVLKDFKAEAVKAKSTKQGNDPQIYVVFISLLLDLLAFTIILPLLPSLLEYFKQNDNSVFYRVLTQSMQKFQQMVGAPERFNSVLFGGFLGSMFSFLQFLASPISGIALSYFLWALSRNFALFVLSRFIGGISKGNISLAMSIITDVSSEKTRSRGMALVGIAFSLGFIFGPMIGAFFAIFANKNAGPWFVSPSLLAFALAIGDLLVLLLCLRETLPKEKRIKQISSSLSWQLLNITSIFRFSAMKNVSKKQMHALQIIGLIYFIYLFLYSALEFTVTFLMYHKFGYTSMDQAKMFLTTGVIMTLLQGSVVRNIPEAKVKNYAVGSLYLLVPAFIFVGMASSTWLLATGMILYAI
uniref:Major facilitator superfamily (MFS) profile domain-containing protein n=1 Tax=Glossina austeni TaxID=7395 RepID=A0A1A9UZZ1_GLOAU